MNTFKSVILIIILFILTGCVNNSIYVPKILENNDEEKMDYNYELKIDHEILTRPKAIIYNNKEKELIIAGRDKVIRILDSDTGIEKRKILGQISNGYLGSIHDISLSPDKKILAVGGYFPGSLSYLRIYEYETGKLIKNIDTMTSNTNISQLKFTEDGNFLIVSSSNAILTLDVKNNYRKYDFSSLKGNLPIKYLSIKSLKTIKKNRNNYAVFSTINNIFIYNIERKKLVKTFKVNEKRFHFDITKINNGQIAVSYENIIDIYDFNFKKIKTIENFIFNTGVHSYDNLIINSEIKYGPDGKFLAADIVQKNKISDEFFSNINVFETTQYKKISTFDKTTSFSWNICFLNSKEIIFDGTDGTTLFKFDFINNNLIKEFKGLLEVTRIGIDTENSGLIAFSHENHFGKNYNKLIPFRKVFDLNTFKFVEANLKNFKNMPHLNQRLNLWLNSGVYGLSKVSSTLNISTYNRQRKIIAKIKKDNRNGGYHNSYGWYKDYIISAGANGIISLYDHEGNELKRLSDHKGQVISLAIDGDRLISAGYDKTIKIWNLTKIVKEKTIKPMVSLFLLSNESKYIIWTPEGFFDASKGAGKYIGYHINRGYDKEAEFVTVENMYSTFYRPDLVQKALKGESLEKYAKKINIDKLINAGFAPEVKILTKDQTVENGDLNVKVQVCPKNGGYDNLAFMINEVPISVTGTSRALKIKKKAKREDCFIIDETLALASGKNEIGFKATNKVGNIESKIDTITVNYDDSQIRKTKMALQKITGKQNVNDLHILAVGVNDYNNKDWKLSLAVNDGRGMLKTIKAVAEPLFKKIHTYELFDKKATKENIIKEFKNIKSTRDDVFLLFVAGHGLTDEFNGDYYFIPVDMMEVDKLKEQGLGQKDLMLGLSKVTALKSLVLLDTCHSGALVEADMQKTTTNKLSRATGRAILSASSSVQLAKEGYKGHGLFTYTLMEALKGKGYYGDEKITVNELADYTEDTLPKRALDVFNHRQTPQRSMYGTDFNIGEFEW